MELSDSTRNAILQTVLVRLHEGEKGAPVSFSPEERELYLEYEGDILSDMAKGIDGNYCIACNNDW